MVIIDTKLCTRMEEDLRSQTANDRTVNECSSDPITLLDDKFSTTFDGRKILDGAIERAPSPILWGRWKRRKIMCTKLSLLRKKQETELQTSANGSEPVKLGLMD